MNDHNFASHIIQDWRACNTNKYKYFEVGPLLFNYLFYELRRQEMSHFEIYKKLKNVLFLFLLCFFFESAD